MLTRQLGTHASTGRLAVSLECTDVKLMVSVQKNCRNALTKEKLLVPLLEIAAKANSTSLPLAWSLAYHLSINCIKYINI